MVCIHVQFKFPEDKLRSRFLMGNQPVLLRVDPLVIQLGNEILRHSQFQVEYHLEIRVFGVPDLQVP